MFPDLITSHFTLLRTSVWRTIACICYLCFKSIRCLGNIRTLSLKSAMQMMARGNDVLIQNYFAKIHAEKHHLALRNSDLLPSFHFHSPCFSVRLQLKGAIVHYYSKQFGNSKQGKKQVHRPKVKLSVRIEHGFLSKQLLARSLKGMLQMWSLKRLMGVTEEF